MAAPVRIEARAWNDIRFVTLARLLGMSDPDLALIKVARLWSWQTEHFIPERPTYVVDADTIESVLGEGGPAALVRARLATPVSGGYRLHGTEGQIEWCVDLSSTRQLAGRARAAGAKRDALGRLLPKSPSEQDYTSPAQGPAGVQQPPAAIQRASSSHPATSSAPSPSPSPEDQNPSPAHAIPPSTVPSTTPAQPFALRDLAKLRERGALAEAIWQRLSELREKHATKLGLAGVLPFPVVHPGNQPRGFRELLDRIREEGDGAHNACDHVLLVLDAQATVSRDIEWLSEKAFLAGPWSKARETPLKPKRKPAQPAQPTPSAPVASPDDRSAWLVEATSTIAPDLLARKEPA